MSPDVAYLSATQTIACDDSLEKRMLIWSLITLKALTVSTAKSPTVAAS